MSSRLEWSLIEHQKLVSIFFKMFPHIWYKVGGEKLKTCQTRVVWRHRTYSDVKKLTLVLLPEGDKRV